VLSQLQGNKDIPIAYASFNKAELNYSIIEKEAAAINYITQTQHFWQTAVNDTKKLVNGISNPVCPKCCVFYEKSVEMHAKCCLSFF
jgi:hypothetical protein